MFKKCWLVILLTLFACEVNKSTYYVKTTENKMYVTTMFRKVLYLIDYETLEFVREITLDLPETFSSVITGICLSTNRDYIFFTVHGREPSPPLYFVIYDIKKDRVRDFFSLGLGAYEVGPVSLTAAQDPTAPGLIYAHFRDWGTYSIDLFKRKIVECISDEHDFTLMKRIIHSPYGKWTVIHKDWTASGYDEIEFYDRRFGLHDPQFVLNKGGRDGVKGFDDIAFSEDNRRLYVSIRNVYQDQGRRVFEHCFGSYDLETKQLHLAPFKLPASLNPYYMVYSPKRQKAYTVGAYDVFYIIDTKGYSILDTITLTGKVQGPSKIILRPDEDVAFVSCSRSDFIVAIDLDTKSIVKKIEMSYPILMIIP